MVTHYKSSTASTGHVWSLSILYLYKELKLKLEVNVLTTGKVFAGDSVRARLSAGETVSGVFYFRVSEDEASTCPVGF